MRGRKDATTPKSHLLHERLQPCIGIWSCSFHKALHLAESFPLGPAVVPSTRGRDRSRLLNHAFSLIKRGGIECKTLERLYHASAYHRSPSARKRFSLISFVPFLNACSSQEVDTSRSVAYGDVGCSKAKAKAQGRLWCVLYFGLPSEETTSAIRAVTSCAMVGRDSPLK